nr:protein NLP5-like [Nicotiana tomentosiformis]
MAAVEADDASKYISTSYFLKYVQKGLILSSKDRDSIAHLKIFWSHGADDLLKEKIKSFLHLLDFISIPTLLQFWAPIITQGKCFLAVKDQPFGISDLRIENTVKSTSKGYLLYAALPVFLQEPVFTARTREYKYSVDIGPLGRVFRNGVLEFCPYVKFYTKNEYPLRDFAQDCGIGGYLALPILEPLGYNCVSVLEFVSICDGSYYLSDKIKQVSEKLKVCPSNRKSFRLRALYFLVS